MWGGGGEVQVTSEESRGQLHFFVSPTNSGKGIYIYSKDANLKGGAVSTRLLSDRYLSPFEAGQNWLLKKDRKLHTTFLSKAPPDK